MSVMATLPLVSLCRDISPCVGHATFTSSSTNSYVLFIIHIPNYPPSYFCHIYSNLLLSADTARYAATQSALNGAALALTDVRGAAKAPVPAHCKVYVRNFMSPYIKIERSACHVTGYMRNHARVQYGRVHAYLPTCLLVPLHTYPPQQSLRTPDILSGSAVS